MEHRLLLAPRTKVEDEPKKGGSHTSVVEEEMKTGAKLSIQLGWRWKRGNKIMKSRKRVENPQVEEFACLGFKFRKACELRVISREACEDRVKFRNSF
jgi:hypothetical protein